MKLKKVILCFLALCILVCTCGCALGKTKFEREGVNYDKHNNRTGEFLMVRSVGCGYEVEDTVYIPDEIDGVPVTGVGFDQWGGPIAKFWGAEKIYFPWSIKRSPMGRIEYAGGVRYIISANTETLIDLKKELIYIIPFCLYNQSEEYYVNSHPSSSRIILKKQENIYPANIAYFFNYEENPNNGYFFIDWHESTGKLTKPPYDPKREGYTFAGWYKEAECVNAWDFENDIVEIHFDEEGNRIYEEFCLYAKWVKK